MTTTQLPQLWAEFAYKAHQVEGVKWLFEQEKKTPSGGIVCDEMGLGKTIQMLALLKMESNTSTLLIAPLAVLSQWEDTAKRCGISTLRPKMTKLHREWKSDGKFRPLAPKLYIIGYEMARNSPQFLTMVEWTRIICDEAHRLASKTSALSSMVSTIRAQSKWFLTATPIVNSTKDIVNLLTLIGVNVSKNPAELLPIVHEYVMARSMVSLRNIAGVSAPPTPEIHREVLPFTSDEEAEFYKGMTGIIVKHWKALDDEVGGSNALLKLRLFMRLRQLSVHPQVYIHARRASNPTQERPDWSGSSTKFDAILRLLKEPRSEKPHKWIIFCHFHAEMELLKKMLEDSMLVGRVFLYNGTLGDSERKLVIAATHESSTTTDVLLIQLQSGGVGLNLQHFDRIIFTGPWWTSALMEQAVGRAVRIGQAEVVHVYHLVLKEEEALNIDQYMMNKAEQKGSLCREILSSAWAGPRDLEAKKN